jgi:hypothetical protein
VACDEGCRERPAKVNTFSPARQDVDPSIGSAGFPDANLLCWPPRVSHVVVAVTALISLLCVAVGRWPVVTIVAMLVMLLAVDPARISVLRALLPGGAEIEASMHHRTEPASTVIASPTNDED